jgi:hypothetical protein
MATTENLISLDKRTKEEQSQITTMGGIASGEARRRKASIRNSLIDILNSGFKLPTEIKDKDIKEFVDKLNAIGVDTKQMKLIDLINCGQILGAISGKADNYKTLLDVNGELVEDTSSYTPNIEDVEQVIDNSNLEKVLYEANKSE